MKNRRLKAAEFIQRRRKKMDEFHRLSEHTRAASLIAFMKDVRVRPLKNVTEATSEPSSSETQTTE